MSSKESQGRADPNTGSDGNQKMLLIVASTVSNTGKGTFSFIRHFIRISLMQNILLKWIICYNNMEEYLNGEWPLNNILQHPIYTFEWFEEIIYILKFQVKYCWRSDLYGGMNWKTAFSSAGICRHNWVRYSH